MDSEWKTFMPAGGEASNLDYTPSELVPGHAHDWVVHERVSGYTGLIGSPNRDFGVTQTPHVVPTPSAGAMGTLLIAGLLMQRRRCS